MMRRRSCAAAWPLAALALAACDGASAPAGAPDAGADAAVVAVSLPPVTIDPGVELLEHYPLPLDAAGPFYARRVRSVAERPLHHLGLFQVPTSTACEELAAQSFLFTSAGLIDWALPDGYALRLDPSLTLCAQLHLVNFDPEPLTFHVRVLLTLADAGTIRPVDFFHFQTYDIRIPPHGEYETTFECRFPVDATLVTLGPHVHSWGVEAEIWHVGDGPGAGQRLGAWQGEGFDILEAPFLILDPPVRIPAGDGLRMRCAFRNDLDREVTYGDGDQFEMCQALGLADTGGRYVQGIVYERGIDCDVWTLP